ncbi:MAG TPA: DUF4147 domain-containing protein, partial [Anaerolineae bacterium]|nr:DUF4147 domain-containing protein [Anaerolineae bacterium]
MPPFDLRRTAAALQRAALAAVEPRAAVLRHVTRADDTLFIGDRRYHLPDYERVFLIAAGKAAVPMSAAIVERLGDRLTAGVVVAQRGSGGETLPPPLTVIIGGHPLPDEGSLRGAQAALALARRATARDLVICLISGGGSALLTLPIPGLELDALR